jgi:hypothetical protein
MTVDGGRTTDVVRGFDLFIRLRNTSLETWRFAGGFCRLLSVLCHPTQAGHRRLRFSFFTDELSGDREQTTEDGMHLSSVVRPLSSGTGL